MAVKAKDSALIWSRDIKSEFQVQLDQTWDGYSQSPVIAGNLLLIDIGGGENKSLGAFDVNTGKTVWTCHTENHPTYSTPLKINSIGQKQIVFNADRLIVSISPSGEILWKYRWGRAYEGREFENKIANPVFISPDKIFVSAIFDIGSSLLQMKNDGSAITVNELWNTKVMQNHITTSVHVGKYIYGFDVTTLKCLEIKTAKITWAKRRLGRGSLIYADKKLIVLSERGTLILLKANHKKYEELCSYKVFDHRVWTPLSLANGLLFLRSSKELVCINLKK